MKPLAEFPHAARRRMRGVLFDIDDTLTTDGRLTAAAYTAIEQLHRAGLLAIPITAARRAVRSHGSHVAG